MVCIRRRGLLRLAATIMFMVSGAMLVVGGGRALAHDPLPNPDVSAFGDAVPYGSTSSVDLAAPVMGMARTHDGGGYWEVASDGGVFSFGDATFYGSMGGRSLNQPLVGMAATPGAGYWLVASDGGVFSFGDARFFGSMADDRLNRPVVGMASTPDGGGYWLVASDGGVFSFGDARFFGSMADDRLNRPVVGMASTPDGGGYWLVASDGGVFSFGDARFFGSMGGRPLDQPVTGMAVTPGAGYWLVAADGGVFSFGDARFYGSYGGGAPSYMHFAGITATVDGDGYWLVASGFCSSYGTTTEVSSPASPAPPAAQLVGVATSNLGCANEVEFRFATPAPAAVGLDVRYVSAPIASPSGIPVQMRGNAYLQVTLHPADSDSYTGPLDILPGYTTNVVEIRQTQNFEGYVTWVIGLRSATPFWVGQPLPGASQFLIVDIG